MRSYLPTSVNPFKFYTIQPEALVLDGSSLSINLHTIVDSGTTLVYLPADITAAINEAFDPPSEQYEGVWVNECSATPPDFAITIGGQQFKISSHELLLQGALGALPGTNLCVSIQCLETSVRKC